MASWPMGAALWPILSSERSCTLTGLLGHCGGACVGGRGREEFCMVPDTQNNFALEWSRGWA